MRLADSIHECDRGQQSMEGAAGRIVNLFYDNLVVKGSGQRAMALVRLFKTHPYGELEPALKAHVQQQLADRNPPASMPCLTLLATAGQEPRWNSRHTSVLHKAIPLASPELVARAPMIARLFAQLGMEADEVLKPDPSVVLQLEEKIYNVFHVETARGSPHVPDQEDFVIRYRIASVVGFGGMLPLGSIFAVILFSLVPVRRETAQLFVPLSVSVKIPLLTFAGGKTFE